jgi:hypothetical protein
MDHPSSLGHLVGFGRVQGLAAGLHGVLRIRPQPLPMGIIAQDNADTVQFAQRFGHGVRGIVQIDMHLTRAQRQVPANIRKDQSGGLFGGHHDCPT